ncbi:MAG: hypothetical protein HY290_31535, partial [Planctomycetia bacterium]|nr:hypothetical protein [Planctomycetia bacterium]
MVAANRSKSADKHEVCRKVTSLLKKTYGSTPHKQELPVLETLLYAVCLENATPEQAGAIYARMLNAFHDLNEVRVSSISELLPVFADQSDPEWRAARAKAALQYVFETNYAFDFESLRRKTAELAAKQLSKIPALSSFVRSYVMQHCLGTHVLPIDDRMQAALVWLGLAEREESTEQAGEHLRSFVRKADAPLFCHLLGCLANDPRKSRAFAAKSDGQRGDGDAISRLEHLLKRGDGGGGGTKSKAHKAGGRAAHRDAH